MCSVFFFCEELKECSCGPHFLLSAKLSKPIFGKSPSRDLHTQLEAVLQGVSRQGRDFGDLWRRIFDEIDATDAI